MGRLFHEVRFLLPIGKSIIPSIKIFPGVQRALIAAITAVMKIHTRYHLLSGRSQWNSSKYFGAEFEET